MHQRLTVIGANCCLSAVDRLEALELVPALVGPHSIAISWRYHYHPGKRRRYGTGGGRRHWRGRDQAPARSAGRRYQAATCRRFPRQSLILPNGTGIYFRAPELRERESGGYGELVELD